MIRKNEDREDEKIVICRFNASRKTLQCREDIYGVCHVL